MSLFKNEKKLCPVCGNPTPKIFPTNIAGQPICRICENKISMEDSLKFMLTLNKLREHLSYREQNFELHKIFTQTRKASTGILGTTICIDDNKQLWYIADCGNEPIFMFDELVSFTLLEDNHILERGSLRGIDTFSSILDGQWNGRNIRKAPEKKIEPPVHTVWLEIEVDNIYWNKFRLRFDSPSIVDNDFNRFVLDYNRFLAEVDRLLQAITTFFPQQSVYKLSIDGYLVKMVTAASDETDLYEEEYLLKPILQK